MTHTAARGLVVGVIVLGLILLGILLWDRNKPSTGDQLSDTQETKWSEQAEGANKDFGLANERAIAGKWATSAASLLGILSTVAFVVGPSNLVQDVGGDAALLAGSLVLVAAGIAAIATMLAALAEQGTPGLYRAMIRSRANRGFRSLAC